MIVINPSPPGLLRTRTFPIDAGRWVLEETWDISTPGCPMIRSPWHGGLGMDGNLFVRQVVMTSAEHAEYQRQKTG